MASGDYDTKITLGMEADLSGGVQTEKQLDQLKRKAREFGKEGESSLGQVQQAVGKLQKSIGFLRSALTGFGAVGAIMGLVSAIGKIRESFGNAKKEAEEFAKAKEKTEHKDAVDALAKSYETLEKSIINSTKAAQRSNEIQGIAKKNARELENAQLDLAEQQELAAVDPSDPAANEIRSTISARYAARRGHLSSTRSREDTADEYNRLNAEAGANRRAANKIEKSTSEDDRLIAGVKLRLANASRRSMDMNEEDITGGWDSVGVNAKRLFTGQWGSFSKMKTEKGDAIRKEAAAEAESLRAELKRLEDQKKAKLDRAQTLRADADHLENRAGAVYGSFAAIDVRETATAVANQSSVKAADTALEKKDREIAKKEAKKAADAATIAQGPGRIAAIEKQIAAAEAQQLAAKQADAKEQMDAILAQQALDSFNSAGHRRNGTGVQKQRSALEADVERETREATQSRAQLQSTLATLAATLKGLNADLNKVKREVDAATKRQAATNDEAPEG